MRRFGREETRRPGSWSGITVGLVLLVIVAPVWTAIQPTAPAQAAAFDGDPTIQTEESAGDLLPGNRIVVGFAGDVPDRLPAYLRDGGVDVLRIPQLDALVLEGDRGGAGDLLEAARQDPAVRYAEHDGRVHALASPTEETSTAPNDLLYPHQWGPTAVDLPAAWKIQEGSHDVNIHVLDTGVDLAHADLASNLCGVGRGMTDPGSGSTPSTPGGSETGFHGTHVAGIASATSDNLLGVAGASQSCLTPVRVLLGAGGLNSWLAAGIVWSADNGADIISMSLGSTSTDNSTLVYDAVRYAHEQGVLLIAAAGNDHCRPVSHPAAYRDTMAVASLASKTERSSFSSCGRQLDIAAPGSDIWSTLPGNTYGPLSGTSMATPLVAGIAGLVLSENPDLEPWTVRCLLRVTAVDLGDQHEFGRGRVNALHAVERAADPPEGCLRVLSAEFPGVVSPSETFEVCWRADGWGVVDVEHAHVHWRREDEAGNETSTIESISGQPPLGLCHELVAPAEATRVLASVHVATSEDEFVSEEREILIWEG